MSEGNKSNKKSILKIIGISTVIVLLALVFIVLYVNSGVEISSGVNTQAYKK